MADINQVISWGIGSPAGVPEFLTFGLQVVAVPYAVAPSARTYIVPVEGRTYTVPVEDRTYIVPVEDRTYIVPED